MSVIQNCQPAAPSMAKRKADCARKKELEEIAEQMRKNPDDFTDDEKRECHEKLQDFDDLDRSYASGYKLVNNDFLYPYAWGGTPNVDATISNVLHVLGGDQVAFVPPCLAFILDNASTNKSIGALRSFGLLLELIPRLQEIHLMFPSVGHTHNSLDAHFGALCKKMQNTTIGTPTGLDFPLCYLTPENSDLAAVFETLDNTKAHLDFAYYQFSNKLDKVSGAYSFDFLSMQHYFLLYRDDKGGTPF